MSSTICPEFFFLWLNASSIAAVQHANSRPYVVLLLHAAGMVSPAPFQQLVAWAATRSSGAESLSVVLRAVEPLETDVNSLRQLHPLPPTVPPPRAPAEMLPPQPPRAHLARRPAGCTAGQPTSPILPMKRPPASGEERSRALCCPLQLSLPGRTRRSLFVVSLSDPETALAC